jgi:hypothetical protein
VMTAARDGCGLRVAATINAASMRGKQLLPGRTAPLLESLNSVSFDAMALRPFRISSSESVARTDKLLSL